MPDEQQQSQVKKTPIAFWKELSLIEIGIILLFIGYMFHLNQTTALILNYNNGNSTRLINGISNAPNEVIYPPNAYVPKSNVSNTQTFVGIGLFLIIVIMLLAKRVATLKRATPKEAMDDLSKQIKQLKNIPLADGTTIPITNQLDIKITPQFLTRYRTIGTERKEFRYPFLVIVKDKIDEVIYYFKAYYHPWTRYWDGFVETSRPLSERDQCPNCGKEYDERWIMGDDIQKFREIRRGIAFR